MAACAILVMRGFEAFADTTLYMAWDPSPSLTNGGGGYYLCWGSNPGQYDHTNVFGPDQTHGDITGLSAGVYYISAKAFNGNGSESDFCNVVIFTNAVASTNVIASMPQLPPLPSANGSGYTNAGSSTSTGSSTNAGSTQVTSQKSYVLGIPPSLIISRANQQTRLVVWGTLDAEIAIQRSANLVSASWQTVTNLTLTNAAELPVDFLYSQRIYGVLSNAFVPAYAELTFDDPDSSALAFHRTEMAYTYPILADKVLAGKGYATRLILVRLSGVTCHDVCFVASENGFIDCLDDGGMVRFLSADSTIRQIAGTVADSLSLNWTSASEFAYSNGMRLLAATVVETDPPASDPVAGAATPQIKINF